LGELDAAPPVEKPTPAPAAAAKSELGQDDLDSLLADLGANNQPPAEKPAPAAAPKPKAKAAPAPVADDDDDLDALLAELEKEPAPAPPRPAAATPRRPRQAEVAPPPASPAASSAALVGQAAAMIKDMGVDVAPLEPLEAAVIFERVAREMLGKLIGEIVPKLVAEKVAAEIEAIKAEANAPDLDDEVVD